MVSNGPCAKAAVPKSEIQSPDKRQQKGVDYWKKKPHSNTLLSFSSRQFSRESPWILSYLEYTGERFGGGAEAEWADV